MKSIIEIVNGFIYGICICMVFAHNYGDNMNDPSTSTP